MILRTVRENDETTHTHTGKIGKEWKDSERNRREARVIKAALRKKRENKIKMYDARETMKETKSEMSY